MSTEPLVTVGVSYKNNAPYMRDLLSSLYAQTMPRWELLLVDDGSTDGGSEFVKQVQDPRVQLVQDGQNRGAAARYNQIVELARGEFIARHDADDLAHPERLAIQVDYLRRHPEVDVLSSDMVMLDEADNPTSRYYPPTTHEEIFANPLGTFRLCHPPLIASKAWFEKNPYPINPIALDYGLFLSSYAHSRYASLERPLMYYRVHAGHSFRKYRRTNLTRMRCLWRHPPQGASKAALLKASGLLLAKVGVYAVAGATGTDRYLVERRGKPATEADKREFERVLPIIRSVSIPGVD